MVLMTGGRGESSAEGSSAQGLARPLAQAVGARGALPVRGAPAAASRLWGRTDAGRRRLSPDGWGGLCQEFGAGCQASVGSKADREAGVVGERRKKGEREA